MASKKRKTKGKAKKSNSSRNKAKKVVSSKSKPQVKRPSLAGGSVVSKRNALIVYGMRIDPEHITRAAQEAYNKRRYNIHDLRLTEYINDPKFRNLMVKIAVLDRIEEELVRLYPDSEVIRPNTVTLLIR